MTVKHLLEDFGDLEAEQLVITDQALEEQRLEAFERGYQAGWDDASKAHANEQSHIGSELARNLQDLSFTLHEAQATILRNLDPLLRGLAETVLPSAARHAFQDRLVEEMSNLAREVGGSTLVLSVSPDQAEKVAQLVAQEPNLNVSVQPDETLGSGQAFLRAGQRERMIDLDTALNEITQMISAYFDTVTEDQKHG